MEDIAGIYARELSALDRHVQLGVASGRVISVSFPDQPEPDAGSDHELLDRFAAYFDGEREPFDDVQVALTLPTDQQGPLEALRSVPYGESVTVSTLARLTPGLDEDDEDAQATVRSALADNPVPVLVPDHRVSDGPGSTPSDVASFCRRGEGL